MDQMIWTTPLRQENQAARREHSRITESEERTVRRRSRMNSTPQAPNFSAAQLPSSFKPRRRLLSTGDIFDRVRGGPSKSYKDLMSEKEKNASLAKLAEEGAKSKSENEARGRDTPGFRGLLRRASIGVKTRPHNRRPSHSEESAESFVSTRPSTSASTWHKLKSAASFATTPYTIEEKSPNLDGHFDYERIISDSAYANGGEPAVFQQLDDQDVPLPGRGAHPPYIPERSGGEAARATAAAQNEVLAQVRRMTMFENRDSSMDWESGVDLGLSTVDSSHSQSELSHSTGARQRARRSNLRKIDPTQHLPYEISAHIFGLLDAKALAKCELVSKRWHSIVSTPAIWQASFFREKSQTFSLGRNVGPDEGLGLPKMEANQDWKLLYRAKTQVEKNWKVGRGKCSYLCGHTDSVYCLQFDEHKIITGSRDRTIRIWDLHTHRCLAIIAHADFERNSKGHDNWTTARLKRPGPPKQGTSISKVVPQLYKHAIHHNASILCLQYDNEILVTGSSDHTAIVHSMKPPYTPLFRLANHRAAILDVAFDDKHIITASKDNSICIYSRATGLLLNTLIGHTAPVNSVQINGNNIVSCSGDASVKLWTLDTAQCIREFEGHTKGLACSQFSADGRYIASAGNDRVIRVYDARTGVCVKSRRAHAALIRSLHWDNVSGRLISGSYDQDILVWEVGEDGPEASAGVGSGGPMGEMPVDGGPVEGGEGMKLATEWRGWHGSWVLACKGDWRRMVSAGQDRRVLVCDFGDGVAGVERLESAGVDADGRMCQGGRLGRYDVGTAEKGDDGGDDDCDGEGEGKAM